MCLVDIFIEFDSNCIHFDIFHRFRSECVTAEVDLIYSSFVGMIYFIYSLNGITS